MGGLEVLFPRKEVKMELDLQFTRRVSVRRARGPMEVLVAATNCKPWVCPDTVSKMPGSGLGIEEVEIVFFNLQGLDHGVDEEELDREYKARGLAPADPFSLAAVNEQDVSFSDRYPSGTHWKNEKGKWCICRFLVDKNRGERRVDVGPRFPYRIWERGKWWFAGIKI